MLRRHEIKVLLEAGGSRAETTRLARALLRYVRGVARDTGIEQLDDARERLERAIGRRRHRRLLARFEEMPGELSPHDVGQVDVEPLNGTIQRIRSFASRLNHCRVVRVSPVAEELFDTLHIERCLRGRLFDQENIQ